MSTQDKPVIAGETAKCPKCGEPMLASRDTYERGTVWADKCWPCAVQGK